MNCPTQRAGGWKCRAAGNDHGVRKLRFGNVPLSGSTGDAMGRPDFELRVVGRVRVGGGNYRHIILPRPIHQTLKIGHDLFRAGNVETTRGAHKIDLRIDIEKHQRRTDYAHSSKSSLWVR